VGDDRHRQSDGGSDGGAANDEADVGQRTWREPHGRLEPLCSALHSATTAGAPAGSAARSGRRGTRARAAAGVAAAAVTRAAAATAAGGAVAVAGGGRWREGPRPSDACQRAPQQWPGLIRALSDLFGRCIGQSGDMTTTDSAKMFRKIILKSSTKHNFVEIGRSSPFMTAE